MDNIDKFFLIFIFICLGTMVWLNGKDLTHIREHVRELQEKVDLVLETQRKTIDVEIKEVKILQEVLKEIK